MPAKPNAIMVQVAKLLKQKWFREFVVARSKAPDGLKYRDSIQSDVRDGRVALVSGTKNASLFVTDLDKSRKFFETAVGLKHLKTGEPVPHPYAPGRTSITRGHEARALLVAGLHMADRARVAAAGQPPAEVERVDAGDAEHRRHPVARQQAHGRFAAGHRHQAASLGSSAGSGCLPRIRSAAFSAMATTVA